MLSKKKVFSFQATSMDRSNGAATSELGTAMYLSNGLYMDNIDGWVYGAPFNQDVGQAILMASLGTGNATKTATMKDVETLIWSVGMIRVPKPKTNQNATWPSTPVEALECALYYCVESFASNVTNGQIYERSTEITAKRLPGSFTIPDLPHPSQGFTETQLSGMEFDNVTSAYSRTDLSLGTDFNVSDNAVNSISSFFQSQFKTVDYVVNNTDDGGQIGVANGFYIQANTLTPQYEPSIMQELYTSPNLNNTFQAIARSMSNAIRAGADGSTKQTGSFGVQVVRYRIEWGWIALHAVVVLCGTTFLLMTAWETRRSKAPVWKSNSLAVFRAGGLNKALLENANDLEAMEAVANTAHVNLFEDSIFAATRAAEAKASRTSVSQGSSFDGQDAASPTPNEESIRLTSRHDGDRFDSDGAGDDAQRQRWRQQFSG
jgi:hypothetical protein